MERNNKLRAPGTVPQWREAPTLRITSLIDPRVTLGPNLLSLLGTVPLNLWSFRPQSGRYNKLYCLGNIFVGISLKYFSSPLGDRLCLFSIYISTVCSMMTCVAYKIHYENFIQVNLDPVILICCTVHLDINVYVLPTGAHIY